jgi:WD40 repeat protein
MSAKFNKLSLLKLRTIRKIAGLSFLFLGIMVFLSRRELADLRARDSLNSQVSDDSGASDHGERPTLALRVGHTGVITSIAYSRDGTLIASGSDDYSVKLWSPLSGQLLRSIAGQTEVRSVAIRADGHMLAAGSEDGTTTLWDVDTGRLVATLHQDAPVRAVVFSPDGKSLVSGGLTRRMIVWNLNKGAVQRVLKTSGDYVHNLSFTPDGLRLVSLCENSVDVWDAATGKLLRRLDTRRISKDRSPNSIAVSHDGLRVAIGFSHVEDLSGDLPQERYLVFLWDIKTGSLQSPMRDLADPVYTHQINALAFDSTDQKLFLGVDDRHILRVNLATSTVELEVEADPNLDCLALSPDGLRLASAEGAEIKLWNVTSGALDRTLAGSSNDPTSVAFSRTGRFLVVQGRDDRVKLWNLVQGLLQRSVEGLGGGENSRTALSSDESLLLSAIRVGDRTVLAVRDLQTSTPPLHLLGDPSGCLQSAAFSPDGSRIIAAYGCDYPEHVYIWSRAGQIVLNIEAMGMVGAVISPNGRTVALTSSASSHVELRSADSGQHVLTLSKAADPLLFVDDNTLLTGSLGDCPVCYGPIKQWNLSTGREVRQFNTSVTAREIALSPDRRVLATAGWGTAAGRGGGIELWDWTTGARLQTLYATAVRSINSLAYSPDGHILAAAGSDTSVMLWSSDSSQLLLQLYGWEGDDWLVVTPEGIFDGTSMAIHEVGWRKANTNFILPLDAFYNDFFHPGLLAEVIEGGRPKPQVDIATALQVPGLRAMMAAKLAHLEKRDGSLVVCFEQKPGAAVNVGPADQRIFFPPVHGYEPGSTPTCKFEKPLPTTDRNSAAMAEQLENWKPVVVTTPWDGKLSDTVDSTLHVLTVGISQYSTDSGFDQLPYAVPSAKAIEGFFREQQASAKKPYATVRVWDGLYDRDATRGKIRQRLSEIAKDVGEDDVVLLYLAGHGKVSLGEEMFYFVPVDGRDDNLDETAVSTAIIAEAIRNLPARRIVLILDACQSGGAIEALSKIGAVKAQMELRRAAQEPKVPGHEHGMGVHLIAATLPLSYAVGLQEGKSALAETLIQALRQGNGLVTAARVSAYTKDQLPVVSDHITHGFRQVPLTDSIGLDFPIAAH